MAHSIPAEVVRTPSPGALFELLKPVTWFPPMWAFACGVVSASGFSAGDRWPFIVAGALLAGPLVCGTSQIVNDWFDRHVDAINEPHRAIPSGRVPGRWGLGFAIVWTVLSMVVAAFLGPWVFAASCVGMVLAWVYSAPPVRLKRNGWLGAAACGLCYEGLPWFTAAAAVSGGLPAMPIVILALLYSAGAHGIMTLNDFKAVEGDQRMQIASLPVTLGVRRAAWVACIVMAVPQAVVVALLVDWGRPLHALGVAAVLGLQLACMARLMKNPRKYAPWYNATGITLYVSGMMVSAFAVATGGAVMTREIGWPGILRLGCVQMALGSVVVLTTSTLNRVMVVELSLPALIPGLLVGIHYAIQVLRPRFGHGADVGGRSTPWIIGGMGVLSVGGILAAFATVLMGTDVVAGVAAAIAAFVLIGVGVGASGTSLLVLLSRQVRADRRAAAASTTWLMMIAGFAITAGIAGQFLDPYTPARLVGVMAATASIAFVMAWLAVLGIEGPGQAPVADHAEEKPPFREALREVWAETQARRFTIFIFVSMLAFSAQDLILEPFAGAVFGYSPGESTQLAGLQHAGVFVGMILVAILARGRSSSPSGMLTGWIVGGCVASALVLFGLAMAGTVGPAWPLDLTVFALGLAVGAFSVAAIGSMMGLVRSGRERREGVRMGLWGAAQGIAFGLGAVVGTGAVDVARVVFDSQATAYSVVFAAEGLLFLVSAGLAVWVEQRGSVRRDELPAVTPA